MWPLGLSPGNEACQKDLQHQPSGHPALGTRALYHTHVRSTQELRQGNYLFHRSKVLLEPGASMNTLRELRPGLGAQG